MLKLLLRGLIALFRSRRDLALENLVLRHQLQVALRNNPTPTLLDQDRIFWVWAVGCGNLIRRGAAAGEGPYKVRSEFGSGSRPPGSEVDGAGITSGGVDVAPKL